MTQKMIPYGRQLLDAEDKQAVMEVLDSDFLTQGPVVTQFENTIAGYCGAEYAVALNSGTSALHAACLALGVTKGDYVWTSPNTFVASANCALYCGAQVDFVDIEQNTGNMSVAALQDKLVQAKRDGVLPKVVIPVHFAGQPCDMAEIKQLADQYGFHIIEDASHAIGASIHRGKVGQCRYSDITIFSFHPVKIITSAEGGMAVTNSAELAESIRLYSVHGITRDPQQMSQPVDGPWSYQQISLGCNYRLSDLHAALGLSQARKIDDFVEKRNMLAGIYDKTFKDLGCRPLEQKTDRVNSYHLYVVLLDQKLDRKNAFEYLRARGIGVNVHYMPVYKQPYYQALGFVEDYCPEAEKYYHKTLTLPLYPALSFKEQQKVIDIVSEIHKSEIHTPQMK